MRWAALVLIVVCTGKVVFAFDENPVENGVLMWDTESGKKKQEGPLPVLHDNDDDDEDEDEGDEENDKDVARYDRIFTENSVGADPLDGIPGPDRVPFVIHPCSDGSGTPVALVELTEAQLRRMGPGEFQSEHLSPSVPFLARRSASVALLRRESQRGAGDWSFLRDRSVSTAFGTRLARAVRLSGGGRYGIGSSVDLHYDAFCAINAAVARERAGGSAEDVAEPLYLAQSDLSSVPAIEAEIELPGFARAHVVHRSMLWVAHNARVTPLHYDDVDNVMAVVQGTKRFTLYPPWEACALDPHAVNGHLHPPDDELEIASSIRPADGMPVRDPRTGRTLDRITVDVGPGDVIFVPAFWWHQVESFPGVGPADPDTGEENPRCVAVNFWLDTTSEPLLALYRRWERQLPHIISKV